MSLQRVGVLSQQLVASRDLPVVGDESMFVDAEGNSLFLQVFREMYAKVPRELGLATYGSYRPGGPSGAEIVQSTVYFVGRASHAARVLESSVEHYLWGGIQPASESFFGAKVLFCLEGAEWRRWRQCMRPVLLPANLGRFAERLSRVGSELVARLRQQNLAEPQDVLRAMQCFHIQGSTWGFYGDAVPAVAAYPGKTAFHESFNTMLDQLAIRAFNPDVSLAFDYSSPNEANDLWKQNRSVIHKTVFDCVRARLQPGAMQQGDLLGELIQSHRQLHGEQNADQVMASLGANIIEVIFAGYNTVTNTLGNAIFLLSKNPDAVRKLRAQVQEVLGDRELMSVEDAEKLTYAQLIFQETLRMLGPVPALARRLMEQLDLDGVVLPKDAEVMIPVDAIHQDASNWPEPESFRPERFEAKIRPGTWLPFSGGERRCLGQHYARITFAVGLCSFVRNFDFAPAPGFQHMQFFNGFGSMPFCANEKAAVVKMMLKPRA